MLSIVFNTNSFAQDNKAKDDLFGKIAKVSQSKKPEDQATAFEMSKDFMSKFGKDTDEKTKKIKEYFEKARLQVFNRALDDVKIRQRNPCRSAGKFVCHYEFGIWRV
jgi:hypothetical protein